MATEQRTDYQQRVQQQLAYWEQFRHAQPLNESGEIDLLPLSGQGTVYSYTQVTTPAAEFEPFAPYWLALVKLDEGPMMTAQLTDVDGPVAIGMRVEMVIRKLRTDGGRGMIVYGPKFRPILEAAEG